MRFRTINFKENQKSSFKDNMWCRTCFLFSETQEHVLQCSVLRDQVQHLNIDFSSVDYKMIFGNLEKQEKIVKITIYWFKPEVTSSTQIKYDPPLHQVKDPCTGGDT